MQYSVIIVNYKTPQLVVDCVSSIKKGTCNNMEIIVVDNKSGDGSRETILTAYPDIIWIDMGYNSGFARANNAGIKIAKGEIVLLLNADTININNAVYKCFTRLEQDRFVAAGIQLLNTDGTPQISGNYIMKGGLNYLMALPYIGRFLRAVALKSGTKKTNVPHATGTVEVDWVNGAFLMVKKAAIKTAGLLDEDFFLYAEEAEWCSRLKKTGRLCIYGDLNAIHLEGSSANKAYGSETKGYQNLSDRKGYQVMLSNFVRFRKEFGVFWYLFHLAVNLITIPVALIVVLFKTIFLRREINNEWKEWAGYSANVWRSLKYFFTIVFNKRYFYKVL
ncbi:MAG: glycosyltransferase family 2 protein [Niabella sp.]